AISGRTYRCLPTLDAATPPLAEFAGLVEEVAGHRGGVYIHCAQGHRRTGMFAAAVLIARGLAEDVAGAVAHLRRVRPGIRLRADQTRLVERFARERKRGGRTAPTPTPSTNQPS